jgi:hypothetical protein
MNVRIVRNLLVIGALCATAMVLPAKQAQAQICDPACQACYEYWAQQYAACIGSGGTYGYCGYLYGQETAGCSSL